MYLEPASKYPESLNVGEGYWKQKYANSRDVATINVFIVSDWIVFKLLFNERVCPKSPTGYYFLLKRVKDIVVHLTWSLRNAADLI